MKHSAITVGGGKQRYSSPEIEVFRIEAEQGFQMSVTNSWDDVLNSKNSWEYTAEDDIFAN